MATCNPDDIKELCLWKYLDVIRAIFDQFKDSGDEMWRDILLVKVIETVGEECFFSGQQKAESKIMAESAEPLIGGHGGRDFSGDISGQN